MSSFLIAFYSIWWILLYYWFTSEHVSPTQSVEKRWATWLFGNPYQEPSWGLDSNADQDVNRTPTSSVIKSISRNMCPIYKVSRKGGREIHSRQIGRWPPFIAEYLYRKRNILFLYTNLVRTKNTNHTAILNYNVIYFTDLDRFSMLNLLFALQ